MYLHLGQHLRRYQKKKKKLQQKATMHCYKVLIQFMMFENEFWVFNIFLQNMKNNPSPCFVGRIV